jgi:hypothetical protein
LFSVFAILLNDVGLPHAKTTILSLQPSLNMLEHETFEHIKIFARVYDLLYVYQCPYIMNLFSIL